MISADVGVSTPLELMLFDGAANKGVLARIRTTSGVVVDTVALAHIGDGLYTTSWIPRTTGYFHVVYIVYTNATYSLEDRTYSRVTEPYRVTDPENLAHIIWDAMISDYRIEGSFGAAVGTTLDQTTSNKIADAVWDAKILEHRLPSTFGDLEQATWEYCRVHMIELQHPVWGLDMIYAAINNNAATIDAHVLTNGTKIDALTPVITLVENNLLSAIDTNKVLISGMVLQNATDKSDLIAEIHHTNDLVNGLSPLITSIQNNTTVRFVVPERLVKPTTGIKSYQFHLRIYDSFGAPTTPDVTPTVRVRRLDTGIDIVLNELMVRDGVKIGAYYYTYNVASSTPEYPALVEATITEAGVARYIPSVTEVTEFESDLNNIQSQLTAMDIKVSNTQSQITNPTYGLAALRAGETSILSAISSEAVTLGLIKANTDLIRADVATTQDINDILMTMGTLPSLGEITTAVNIARDDIMGRDHRDLSDVYELWDTADLLKTNDPRLSFLDARISTRSTLTASEVWGYSSRTLTSYPDLTATSAKAIWDYLCHSANVPGSIGERISSMLDVAVSTRATESEMLAALDGVAKESTLYSVATDVTNGFADTKSKLINITNKTVSIQAKTNLIPTNPATETSVTTGNSVIRSDLANMSNQIYQIKAQADRIPIDPAHEATVAAIPTNPVLTNDPRLTNLDAAISTRSTLTVDDLHTLASASDVSEATNDIVSEIRSNHNLISTVMTLANYIKVKTDRIPSDPATLSALLAAKASVLDAIAHISTGGGSGASAADVWAYSNRTLTQDPTSFGPDISNLATKQDVAGITAQHYINRMSTTFSPDSSYQEVIAWSEKDGQRRVDTSDCVIAISDSSGTVRWTQTSSSPNADGVYRFINPIVVSADSNYYIVISIKVDGEFRTTQQAFITIG